MATVISISGLQRLRKGGVYVLALAAGLTSAWAVREHVQQRVSALEVAARVPMVSRLVAAYDLSAGTLLDEAHLALREIPTQWAPRSSLDADALVSLLGASLTIDVAQGEPLLRAHFTHDLPEISLSSRLPAGRRAVTIAATDLGGLAEMLRPGDVIDIYVSLSHRQRDVTVPLLQGVRVLTLGGDAQAATAYASITLETSPEEALRLLAARQSGTLTAMLRHRDDLATVTHLPRGDLAALIGLDRVTESTPSISILYGDRVDDQSASMIEDMENELIKRESGAHR